MTERKITRLIRSGLLTMALAIGVSSGRAEAASIGLNNSFPDITASFLTATYDTGSGAFLAEALWLDYFTDALSPPLFVGNPFYSIEAHVDNSGAFVSGDQEVLIKGDIGGGDETLLAGTIIAFGFNGLTVSGSSTLEFLVNVTGGLPFFGSRAGIIVSQLNFIADPINPSKHISEGISDNFAVPVPDQPGTLGLLSIALSSLVAAARRRNS